MTSRNAMAEVASWTPSVLTALPLTRLYMRHADARSDIRVGGGDHGVEQSGRAIGDEPEGCVRRRRLQLLPLLVHFHSRRPRSCPSFAVPGLVPVACSGVPGTRMGLQPGGWRFCLELNRILSNAWKFNFEDKSNQKLK